MKRITQTNEIKSYDNTGVVFSGDEKASYSEDFVADDFTSRELVPFSVVEEMVGKATNKITGEYTVGDIDSEGNISVSDINPGLEKWLLGARVTNLTGGISITPVSGAEYDPLAAKVSGFGGWIDSTDDISINITFI